MDEPDKEQAAQGDVDDGLESLMQEETEELLQGAPEQESPFGADDPFATDTDAAAVEAPAAEAPATEATDAVEPSDGPPAVAAGDSPDEGEVEGASTDVDAVASSEEPDELTARAADAAASLLEGESQTLQAEAEEILAEVEQADDGAKPKRNRQDAFLVGLLISNLVLMGVMLAIPGEDTGKSGSEAPHVTTGDAGVGSAPVDAHGKPNPFHAPLQEPEEFLPNHEMYDAGVLLIAKGNYEKAIRILERYLKAHPELQAFQLQMVYSSLAYCMRKVGRQQDAMAYLAKNDNLRLITALPDDLWSAAQRAEVDGRGMDMRRYYARFLLQQDQLGKRWATQGKIAEAYMKIGDSYRIDAERAARMEDLEPRINLKLKRRREKARGDTGGGAEHK